LAPGRQAQEDQEGIQRAGADVKKLFISFSMTDKLEHFIVSKGGEETLYVRRRLLSKSEYPFWVAHQHFIVERKEGETG
jgi:hypothetical protein